MHRYALNCRGEAMSLTNDLARVAEQYRSEGYQVTLHPNGAQVPPFVAGFHPDLLAIKDDVKALVQVKKDQTALRQDKTLPRMAEIINAQPGWRFDLVVLNNDAQVDTLPENATEPPLEALSQSLDRAEQIGAKGYTPMAFLLAWASL